MKNSTHNAMTIDATAIESLARRLAADEPVTLDAAERSLLLGVLRQLGADQLAMLRLARLLTLHEESSERIGRIAAEALGEIRRRMNEPALDDGYDYAAAASARERLAEKLQTAADGREAIGLILAFARDLAVILR
ncbi:MAG: hypothetical protein EA376_02720 [Phycisphaeraceae bacterium]|nr:MAG: hypothetical protein EA376_02720 [Phycisphaeraceae bacterium]